MYKIKRKVITKTAGTSVPNDQKMWPAEVLKALVSQHNYIDTSQIKIVFTRVEPESKTSSGKIIIQNSAAIPFTIRKNDKTKKLELDPLDILFDGEQFSHLNEQSLQRAIEKQQVGRLVKKDDKVPPANRYIGDVTGDVTPLEWSSYPAGFGSGTVTAGQGLLSYVIKNQRDVSRLFNILATYDGINSSVEAMGLRDSLENLKDGLMEGSKKPVQLCHVIKRPAGGFAIAFDEGDTRAISAKDLKAALGENFQPVMRHVLQRGWAMVRDFPVMRASDSTALSLVPSPVEIGGRYRIRMMDGSDKIAIVCDQMIDFDGSVLKTQKAICEKDGSYYEGKAIQGWPLPAKHMDSFNEYKRQGHLLKMRDRGLNADVTSFPIGVIDTGKVGCFIDESWGTPKATPSVKINQIISVPGEPDILLATRQDTQEKIGLVSVPALVRPQKICPTHYDTKIMPPNSYYIPGHMSFVETPTKIAVSDKEHITHSKIAYLKKNAGRYILYGETKEGQVEERLDPVQMRQKLAWLKVDDGIIEDAMGMKEGEQKELYDLESVDLPEPSIAKTANLNIDPNVYKNIKLAANEAMEGVDQAEEAQDPRTLDAILSLQFVSDENLEELVDSTEVFQEAEDRLARLLLAARQGEKAIHEKAVQRALKGIGEARKGLKALEVELESRET